MFIVVSPQLDPGLAARALWRRRTHLLPHRAVSCLLVRARKFVSLGSARRLEVSERARPPQRREWIGVPGSAERWSVEGLFRPFRSSHFLALATTLDTMNKNQASDSEPGTDAGADAGTDAGSNAGSDAGSDDSSRGSDCPCGCGSATHVRSFQYFILRC